MLYRPHGLGEHNKKEKGGGGCRPTLKMLKIYSWGGSVVLMSSLLRCYGYYELFETLNFHLQLASYNNDHLYI